MLQTIRQGSAGTLVRAAMLLCGYEGDGDTFDAAFEAHVKQWQAAHALTADGIIGPRTWTALAEAQPTVSTTRNRVGAAVEGLQRILGGNLTPDGIYGPRTRAAVVAYQTARGLTTDGVCGPRTWRALITGASSVSADALPPSPKGEGTAGAYRQPVDYKQGDARWGGRMYSSHNDSRQTMANSGCGPTAMADIVATLIDPGVTPYDLALLSMQWGTRTYSSGTSWDFFTMVAKHYAFAKMIQTASLETLKACLDAGGYAVCSMGPGYWTRGGHYICAWRYDDTYIYCNDPGSSGRTRQRLDDFARERKQFFCFHADAPGRAIVDISRWDGDIDFDRLKGEVALVIARATSGGDVDARFGAYAAAMNDRGIPFGVYGYSYADTAERARDEARRLVETASKVRPLFYVMDAEEAGITREAICAYADALRACGASKVGCYVAHHRYREYGFDGLRERFDFVWIPRYGGKRPDYRCDLWQYTDDGRVPGIDGAVDLNAVTSDGRGLEWFLNEEGSGAHDH